MNLNLTEIEIVIVKGFLTGAMREHNRRVDNDHYFTSDEKEIFETIKGLLEKLEEKE